MHPQKKEAEIRRELNERIADEVMGLIVVKDSCPEAVFPGMVMTNRIFREYFQKHPDIGASELETYLLKSYSVLPKYAFDVMKRMQSLGFDYEIKSQGNEVTATFRKEKREGTGTSDSFAKSVCIAALEAIEGYWEER